MSCYTPMKSVLRTMAVLEELNRRPLSRVQDLELSTGLPGPTIIRILETLGELGYVRKEGRRIGYRLTAQIRQLSSGFTGLPVFIDSARAVLSAITRDLGWPTALATLDDTAMVVRLSTIPESPMSHTGSTLNKRLDLLTRAHGRAYLAFCSDEERDRLFRRLCEIETSRLSPAELADRMEPTLAQTRHLGFAERAHEIDPQTSTLAVPVTRQGVIEATIGVTFFAGSRPDRRALADRLHAASREIGGE